MPDETQQLRALAEALRRFADDLRARFASPTPGEPEEQLRGPVEGLLGAFAAARGLRILCKGESRVEGGVGTPDLAVEIGGVLVGYVELKAPGKGADPGRFGRAGHDARQWKRFRRLPNLVYTDGREWSLQRDGVQVGRIASFRGDPAAEGARAVDPADAAALEGLLADFTSWSPVVPRKPKALAAFLAPYAALLRDEVAESLERPKSPLLKIRNEMKEILLPQATDAQFADAYAQSVLFSLLLARCEGADVSDLRGACSHLEGTHLLLGRVLQEMTLPKAQAEVRTGLSVLVRLVAAIDPAVLVARDDEDDPWLFFYEHFLAGYDPALRKSAGAYYTPLPVVRCQIRCVEGILRTELGKSKGLLDAGVSVLDPAAGTGTYMLAAISAVAAEAERRMGAGAVGVAVEHLVQRLFGFEWMFGPYAVAQLRLVRALRAAGADEPVERLGFLLTNTLADPYGLPPEGAMFLEPIADQHRRAIEVKDKRRILVIVGNPPYERHEAGRGEENEAVTGAWVRHGGTQGARLGKYRPIFEDFREPAIEAGQGVHVKNLYNAYVYFLRWALWKLFENRRDRKAEDPSFHAGLLAYITASSYLDGPAFVGVRSHLRKVCDEIRIVDLHGEGRGTRQDENVFDIKTPVALIFAWRRTKKAGVTPGRVRYASIRGTREEKFAALGRIASLDDLAWEDCPSGWREPFRPRRKSAYATWPLLGDVFPWSSNGVQVKRTWPIAPDPDVLRRRWRALLAASDRGAAMRETGDRTVDRAGFDLERRVELPPISKARSTSLPVEPTRFGFRVLDRQWLLADSRLIDRPRPGLWITHGSGQVYLSTLHRSQPLGSGPALVATSCVPDLHHFRGSFGGRDVHPLFRDAEGVAANLDPEWRRRVGAVLKTKLRAEDLAAYVYALLAHPAYTRRFERELESREIRVPITKDRKLFRRAVRTGEELLWLHTFGERFADARRRPAGRVPEGAARCIRPVPSSPEGMPREFSYDDGSRTLVVGTGAFAPVAPEVWAYEVSGYVVVSRWLGQRMAERTGRRSSPLDEIGLERWTLDLTKELLELLWVLERTVALQPEQEALLEEVCAGELFTSKELPPIPPSLRKPPNGDALPLYEE